MKNNIFTVAKKEIMDNVRNKWILAVTILIIALTLLSSFAGSYWKSFEGTVSGMMATVTFFISIIGLMLGYGSIVGEVERGSMSSLITHPITRLEILLGKLIGNGIVLTFSILIGFGIGGIIVGFNVDDVNVLSFIVFIAASILIGLIFLSLSMLFSSLFKIRSMSMGLSIITWIFSLIIYPLIIGSILFATNADQFQEASRQNINSFIIPDWFYAADMANPTSAYSNLVSINVLDIDIYPSFVNNGSLLLILFLWLAIPLIFSYILFRKRDI